MTASNEMNVFNVWNHWNGCNYWNANHFPVIRLKNPSFSSSSRMLSSRYLFKLVSSLGFSLATSSSVFCKPTWETRVGKENLGAKYL